MQTYDYLPARLPPPVCLAEHLANDHWDCTLALPRKINFVRRACWLSGKRKILAVWTVVTLCYWTDPVVLGPYSLTCTFNGV